MMRVTSVLLIGFGSIGRRHLNNLKCLLPKARLIVLRSRSGGAPIDGCETVTTIEEALDLEPDMAVICSPSNYHISQAERLASMGVNLFIEKPLSNRIQGVEKLVDIIDHHKLKVMVGYNFRFSPSLLAFKSLLDHEEFGRVLTASAEVGQYLPTWRPDVDYRSTVSARSDLGGGVLLELSHELDYLVWFFGTAVATQARLMKVSDLELDVEDLVMAQIDFQNQGHQLPVSVHLDFLQRKPYRRCKAVCEQATLVWDAISGSVEVHLQEGSSVYFQDDKERNFTYMQELRAFIDCIETGTAVPVDIHDGLGVLSLIEAMRKSSESRSIVYL